MVAGQYLKDGDEGYQGTAVKDMTKAQVVTPTVGRPEGNWEVIHHSNPDAEPVHVVEAKVVEGDYTASVELAAQRPDPRELISTMMATIKLSPQQLYFCIGPEIFLWISGGNGSGKCISPETLVVLYDEHVKRTIRADQVMPGMQLMGPGRTSRTVLSITSGIDEMYRITPTGPATSHLKPFVCNHPHILTLQYSFADPITGEQLAKIVDLPLNEYLTFPADEQAKYNLVVEPIPHSDSSRPTPNLGPAPEVLYTHPFTVEHLGPGPYSGWTLDGDGRFLLSDGTITHNTFAGAVFVYMQIICNPDTLGLIAANSYAQLNQSTLKPLFEFLEKMGMPYVVNKIPPASWGLPRQFTDYEGVLVFPTGAHILLRSLDRPANIEGLCFGAGTKVKLYDPNFPHYFQDTDTVKYPSKNIEDLQVGDCLVGPEGLPRIVTAVSRGYGRLYQIIPQEFSQKVGVKNSDARIVGGGLKEGAEQKQGFVCNIHHILVLYHPQTRTTHNISLLDYLRLPAHVQAEFHYLYVKGAHVPFSITEIPPGMYHGLLVEAPDFLPADTHRRFLLADGTVVHNTIGWYWVDETRYTRPKTYNVIVNRLRCNKSVWRVGRVTSTSDGHNWLYKIFKSGMKKLINGFIQYRIIFMSSRENPHLPAGFIETLELQWDEFIAPQEIDGRIIALQVGRTYYAYSEIHNRKIKWRYDPDKPLVLCWDFNASVMPMALVVAQEHFNPRKQWWEVQVIGEIVRQYSDTETICVLFMSHPIWGQHQGGIHIYGDSKRATSSKSDYAIIKEHLAVLPGYVDYVKVGRNPQHGDRTNSVNGMLKNKRGRRLFLAPQAENLHNDMIGVKPDDTVVRKNKIDKTSNPLLTHPSDGLGYFLEQKYPVVKQDARNFQPPSTQMYIST